MTIERRKTMLNGGSTVGLRSIRRKNLREEALEILRAAILGGELAPGTIHSAVTLAEHLDVSPTPVREAMLDLARAGLVEVLPNRGFRVTVIDDRDLDEICELRLLLEVPAMALVIERASDSALGDAEELLTVLDAAAARRDVPAYLLADRAFHLSLLSLTGNQRLVDAVARLRDQTRIVGLQSLARTDELRASSEEHRLILDALRARDPDAARRLMATHLQHTRGIWANHALTADAARALP